jgi:hypothetical protein
MRAAVVGIGDETYNRPPINDVQSKHAMNPARRPNGRSYGQLRSAKIK